METHWTVSQSVWLSGSLSLCTQGEGIHPEPPGNARCFLLLGDTPDRVQPTSHLQTQKEEQLQPDCPQTQQDRVITVALQDQLQRRDIPDNEFLHLIGCFSLVGASVLRNDDAEVSAAKCSGATGGQSAKSSTLAGGQWHYFNDCCEYLLAGKYVTVEHIWMLSSCIVGDELATSQELKYWIFQPVLLWFRLLKLLFAMELKPL